ncbi:MAG TPA: hypothetical protein VIK99_01185 [Thermaerobacter sp.]
MTDERVIAEAADLEGALEAFWRALQRGWPVRIVRNPLTLPDADEPGREWEAS